MRELIRNWNIDKVITNEQLAAMRREAEALVKISDVLKDVAPENRSKVLMASAVMSYEPPERKEQEDEAG